jgi:S1-C subfamily serine protease
MQTGGGALVQQVSPDSPAAKAGIRAGDRTVTVQGQQFVVGGDVIVKADDTDIRTADDLIAFLGTKKPGDTITVTVERDGKTHDLKVTLAERPGNL